MATSNYHFSNQGDAGGYGVMRKDGPEQRLGIVWKDRALAGDHWFAIVGPTGEVSEESWPTREEAAEWLWTRWNSIPVADYL